MRMDPAVIAACRTNTAIPKKPIVKWKVKEKSSLAFSRSSNRVGSQRKSKKKLIIKIYTPWVMLLYTFISCIQYLIKCVLSPLAIFYAELKLQ